MDIFLLILKAIGVIMITSFIASSLIGLVTRMLCQHGYVNDLRKGTQEHLGNLLDDRVQKKSFYFVVTLSGLFIIFFLLLYYQYLGIYVTVALLLMIIFKIPNLVNDIHGKKHDKKNYFIIFLTLIPILLILWNYFFRF